MCKIMEKMWKVYGKNMEMIWKRCGKDVEKVWTICGKAVYVERLGKGCGQIWRGCGNKFEKGFRKGYWKTAERLRKGCRNCVEMMYTVQYLCAVYLLFSLFTIPVEYGRSIQPCFPCAGEGLKYHALKLCTVGGDPTTPSTKEHYGRLDTQYTHMKMLRMWAGTREKIFIHP